MRPPVEGLGRQAHAPGSGIMVLYCEYGCSCVVVFFFPEFSFLVCVYRDLFCWLWISYIYPMEAKSSHLIHVFHVMAMCRTVYVWIVKR